MRRRKDTEEERYRGGKIQRGEAADREMTRTKAVQQRKSWSVSVLCKGNLEEEEHQLRE